jgi:hypothetical protein
MLHSKRNSTLAVAAAFISIAIASVPCDAMWMRPTDVPAERVIANLNKRLAEKPDDVAALYSLGRVHSYLLTHGSKTVPVTGMNEDSTSLYDRFYTEHKAVASTEAAGHASAALRAFNRAIRLSPNDASIRYSLACLSEASQEMADRISIAPMLDAVIIGAGDSKTASEEFDKLLAADKPDVEAWFKKQTQISFDDRFDSDHARAIVWTLARLRAKAASRDLSTINKVWALAWKAETAEQYFEAFSLSLPEASTIRTMGMRGLSDNLCYQAATDYTRVVTESDRPPVRRDVIAAAIKSFSSLPPCRAITPIIVPLSNPGPSGIHSLLDESNHVKFNLDASGRGLSWPWLTPATGILVWDPSGRGQITSGAQLFGSVTWWMMFENGYSALDTLDDNRDGELSGAELQGLSLWVDANSNGVCEPGEVKRLRDFGITALSVKQTGTCDEGSLVSDRGVRFADGHTLPTFDWITHPVTPTATVTPSQNDTK